MQINNEQEYLEALARLCAGADYIDSDVFKREHPARQKKAMQKYDMITDAIMKYKEQADEK